MKTQLATLKMALHHAGTDWHRAKMHERDSVAALYKAIILACDAGISEVEAAKLAGVDRMTVRRARGKL